MNRRERVLSALRVLAQQRSSELGTASKTSRGFTTEEIAKMAGITRSNCSGELSALCRLGLVTKFSGRPVLFLPNTQTDTARPIPGRAPILTVTSPSSSNDAFNQVVGATRSLSEAVRMAKVAVRYPPRGMHTLLLGEAGVGKSMFAHTMYQFAIADGTMATDAPFISFNCAEYANNPEMLLDQLFGHVKGAYTGATTDKAGLIELAHEGVLFLDEIHRLPPQGQEMLFHWLDTGMYRRMGESGAQHQCHARLIAATTETDPSTLLITFRRRIPVTIHLAPLREWSIYDRYELIYRFALEEAETLGLPIRVSGAAVDRLLFAHIPGNIGGLKNALKLACARAFALDYHTDELVVDRHHVQSLDVERISLMANGSMERIKDIRVTPSDNPPPSDTVMFEDSLYGHLASLADRLQDIGMAQDEIVIAIERELLRRQFSQSAHPSLAELKRFVGETFNGWMQRSWNTVAHRIDPAVSETAFIRVSMHLSGLTRDGYSIPPQLDTSIFQHVQREYPELCSIAEALLIAFARESGIRLPDHEVALVGLLLNPTVQAQNVNVGLVLMMQGDGIATQLTETVRQVNKNVHLICVDVPLGAERAWVIEQAGHAAELAAMGNGVFFMTDLSVVQEWLSNRPGIGCLFRPDLTDILQVVLALETGFKDVDDIVRFVNSRNQRWTGVPLQKKRQVWTCCMTGRGSAMALKRLIEHALPTEWLDQIEIVPVEVSTKGVASVAADDSVIAAVGSVRPQAPGIPFLSVEELLTPGGIQRLTNVISQFQPGMMVSVPYQHHSDPAKKHNIRAYVESMLEKDLTVVNAKLALTVAEEAIESLKQQTKLHFDEAWFARFAIHMAYVVERNVRRTPLDHPDAEQFMSEQNGLWSQMRIALASYEKWFQIELSVGELAYVFNMIMTTETIREISLT